MSEYYDKQGKPIDLMTWAKSLETNRHVARTEVNDKVTVSTVWLGLDHNFGLGGPPLIFETMIFGGPLDQEMDSYSTLEEALEGHERMLQRAIESS